MTPQERLVEISLLIYPCSPPDVANGYDHCPAHPGHGWPCFNTKAAWLARGLDRDTEVAKAMKAAMQNVGE